MMTRDEVLHAIKTSPAYREPPESIATVIRLLDSPDASDHDLAAAIKQDSLLTRIVLSNANSPLYNAPHYIETVDQAVTLLGFEVVRNFVAHYLNIFMLPEEDWLRPSFNIDLHWRHAIATSVAADMLGRKIREPDPFRTFTYGLIHNIGYVVLEACLPQQMDLVYGKMLKGVPMLVAEHAILGGTTHEDVGAWICDEWELPEDLHHIIRHHHSPGMAEPDASIELKLIYIGNILATRVYEHHFEVPLGHSHADDALVASLGLTYEDIAEVDAHLDEHLEDYYRHFITLQ